MMNDNSVRYAYVHRLIAPDHVCPLGRKSVNLLKRKGYTVVDRPLRDSVEEDAFKAEHGVQTTPQIFIDGRRIGGYSDLRRHFGLRVHDIRAMCSPPVLGIVTIVILMILAAWLVM
ncbi:MAG: hypothetical protein KIT21_33690 [Shinella sp.]|nr:hypothetical protein [Shinella sp.]